MAFIFAPGVGFCSGTLIASTVVLTAAHCTSTLDAESVKRLRVSFDDQVTSNSTFYTSSKSHPHPEYINADWLFEVNLPFGVLSGAGLLYTIISNDGASDQNFVDVGYGQTDVATS